MEEVTDIDLVSRSRLEELPDVLLQHRVFPLLDATALGRLACCNSRLNIAALADHLWYPLFVQNNSSFIHRNPKHYNKKGFNDPPPYPWQTWHQAFSSKQNIRCVECKEHTPYVFTLLPSNVRLCERCEYTCPKYALVTEREARGHYLLDDEDLRSLQFKKVKIKKFDIYLFLRSAVGTLAHGKGAEFEGRDLFRRDKHEEEKNSNFMEASCSESSVEGWTQVDENGGETNNDPDDSETLAEGISNTIVLSKMNKNEKSVHGSAELSQDMIVQGLENAENAFDREGRKALRKKHKQQVKAENREKRMGKKTGRSPHGEHSFAENSGKKSLHLKEIEDADENSNVGDRDKVKKKHRRTKRDHVSASKGVYRQEQFLGYNSQLTTKSLSDWVQERDWLESELGRNGISALELAQF